MNLLAQDRESLYYFNLREIPPKSSKPNTLQIALQTRIKLFYRPAALKAEPNGKPWQEQVTLTKEGGKYVVHNPTPYFVTFTGVSPALGGESLKDFNPLMLEPMGKASLGVPVSAVGNNPVLTYVNDYGGRPKLIFSCAGNSCTLKSTKVG
jgi:P pilus assembly chaperone PapD